MLPIAVVKARISGLFLLRAGRETAVLDEAAVEIENQLVGCVLRAALLRIAIEL